MIQLTNAIALKPIQVEDAEVLYTLMKSVYTQAYDYFWKDAGNWYVNTHYSKENLEIELANENADYYFIWFEGEPIGNFRILWNEFLPGFSENLRSVKLHRIYLDEKTQGKGIGKILINWLEQEAIKKQYELLWLDAMDKKNQAFHFYKKLGYQYHSHCFLSFDLLLDKYRKMSQLYKKLS